MIWVLHCELRTINLNSKWGGRMVTTWSIKWTRAVSPSTPSLCYEIMSTPQRLKKTHLCLAASARLHVGTCEHRIVLGIDPEVRIVFTLVQQVLIWSWTMNDFKELPTRNAGFTWALKNKLPGERLARLITNMLCLLTLRIRLCRHNHMVSTEI